MNPELERLASFNTIAMLHILTKLNAVFTALNERQNDPRVSRDDIQQSLDSARVELTRIIDSSTYEDGAAILQVVRDAMANVSAVP